MVAYEMVDIQSYKTHCFWTQRQKTTSMACGSFWSVFDQRKSMISHFPRVLFLLENRLLFLTTNVFISVWSLAINMMSQSTLITSLFPTPCIIVSLYQDQEKDLFMVFEYMKVKRKQLSV